MKLINGQKYSSTQFDEYKLRVMIKAITNNKDNSRPYPYERNLTIYTTETNVDEVVCVLEDIKTDKVSSFKIIHTATKEQDDLSSKFIKETLKDW